MQKANDLNEEVRSADRPRRLADLLLLFVLLRLLLPSRLSRLLRLSGMFASEWGAWALWCASKVLKARFSMGSRAFATLRTVLCQALLARSRLCHAGSGTVFVVDLQGLDC